MGAAVSGWKAKRFWKTVTVEDADGGFRVLLDTRPVRTPAKTLLALPTRALALAVADEWRAVKAEVDPRQMPVTRGANAALDKVTPQFEEVAGLIAAYGGSDLLCYRAVGPEELALAQAAAWDPMLDWAASRLGAPLLVTQGIAPVAQPPASLENLAGHVFACTPFQLTALHDLVSLSGSLVLGLAATTDDFAIDQLWHLSRFDEEWQSRLWGEDDEASAIADKKRKDFLRAWHFWKYSTLLAE